MAELKTKVNDSDVTKFLNDVENEKKREASFAVLEIMRRVTGETPKMWGSSIIGFGTYSYKYESGREGEWFLAGFSPRKQNITLYIMSGFSAYEKLLEKLGKHKTGKSCLYINKLEDIDVKVLEELVRQSITHVQSGEVRF